MSPPIFMNFYNGAFFSYIIKSYDRPRGKECTIVRITQNKGKERKNSYQKLKRSPKEGHMET